MLVRFAILVVSALIGADTPATTHVRSSHPYIRAMIAEAQVRSPTFRRLVDSIEGTDGIVYVEQGDCYHRLRSCLPPLVTAAGAFRFLRVIVDPRQQDWEVRSDIGHELQHALEVLSDPTARTDASLFFLVSKSSFGAAEIRETPEAVTAGESIKKEVKAFARRR